MEEQREESEFAGVYREPMEEVGMRQGLSSQTETLDGDGDAEQKEYFIEDANTVEVSNLGLCDVSDGDPAAGDERIEAGDDDTVNPVSDEKQVKVDIGSVEDVVDFVSDEKTVSSDDVERTDAITESETERNDMEFAGDAVTVEVNPVDKIEGSELCKDAKTVKFVEVEMKDETAMSEIKSKNDGSHETAGEDETVTSAGNEVADETEKHDVEDHDGAVDAEQNVQTEKSQKSSDGGMLSITEKKADQEKESAKESEEDNNKMDIDSKQADEENVGLNEQGYPESETKDAKHSESVQVPEESTQLSKGETNIGNLETVSEVGSAAERCHEEEIASVNQKEENGEAMEMDYVAEGQVEKDVTAGGASVVQAQGIPIAETDINDADVVKEMEIDENKDNVDMTSDLTGTNPNSLTEDAAPGEVESLDHNALFDPSSDITNFIDFSGVSSWSGNIQDLKTEIGNVEDKKVTDMAEEVTTVDRYETHKSVDATVNAESRNQLSLSAEGIGNVSNEAHLAFGAESPAAATDSFKEASDAVLQSGENQEDKDHECLEKKTANQQDTDMEENLNNSDYADDGTGSDIKTNGVKRKADVLSEDLPGEGRKTVSLAKVSFAQRPSFKIGACIARAASQMAGSPSVLKASNFGDETLCVESFVSQLHCAATDPVKETVVSDIATGFFLDFRNSFASQQVTPEKVSSKRIKTSNSNVGGTEAYEFEEMGDTYWTDRVIHNGGEEQTAPSEKENYQVVPVELKPAQVRRTRRPYRRRQSQIIIPHPASEKPADFDENAPAELIMNFSEVDTIPPEKSLTKMFRHFGSVRESQTEVDRENNRARVVFKKGADAKVAYNSVGRFNIFGTKAVNYELSSTITETFKVQPYVVSLGEEDAELCLPS